MLYNQIEYCYTLFLCKHLCKRVFENNFYQDEKIVDLGFVFFGKLARHRRKGLS